MSILELVTVIFQSHVFTQRQGFSLIERCRSNQLIPTVLVNLGNLSMKEIDAVQLSKGPNVRYI